MTKHNFSYANDFCDKALPDTSCPLQYKFDAVFYALIGGEELSYSLFKAAAKYFELVAYISDEVLVLE